MNDICYKVSHPNGYTGYMYGKSSLKVFDSTGEEILHTGFRSVNSEEELYELLGYIPAFLCILLREET